MKSDKHGNRGGVALDKLAGRGHNAEGTRKRLEKLKNHELNKKQKLKKLKKRLDGSAEQHAAAAPRDNVAELEGLLGMQHAADQNQKSVKKASSKPSSKSTTAADDQQVEPRGKHKADDGKSKQQQQQQQQQLEDKLGATEQSLGGQLGQGGGQGAGRRDADNHAKPQVGIQQTQQPATQHQRQPLGKPGKPVPRMQRLMAEAAQRKAEAQAAREAALQAKAEKQARTEAAQKLRTQQKKHFFKRNRAGQPLMQYRIEKILKQLENEQQGG